MLLCMTVLLSGCSGLRLVDSDVTAFPGQSVLAVPTSYRFDRLPSQQATPQLASALEAVAQTVLARVGMVRDDASAVYSLQFELRIVREPLSPWDDPVEIGNPVGRMPLPGRTFGVGRFPRFPSEYPTPYYRREIAVIVRRVSDARVVLETRAKHDGVWGDDEAVLPAMLQAALMGFPDPPPGQRQIVVEIPR
jgi:hypothetical protein